MEIRKDYYTLTEVAKSLNLNIYDDLINLAVYDELSIYIALFDEPLRPMQHEKKHRFVKVKRKTGEVEIIPNPKATKSKFFSGYFVLEKFYLAQIYKSKKVNIYVDQSYYIDNREYMYDPNFDLLIDREDKLYIDHKSFEMLRSERQTTKDENDTALKQNNEITFANHISYELPRYSYKAESMRSESQIKGENDNALFQNIENNSKPLSYSYKAESKRRESQTKDENDTTFFQNTEKTIANHNSNQQPSYKHNAKSEGLESQIKDENDTALFQNIEKTIANNNSKPPRYLYNTKSERRESQIKVILKFIKHLKYEPLSIPDGGRSELRKLSMAHSSAEKLNLFSKNSFDNAWEHGVDNWIFRMKNHDVFAKRGGMSRR